MDGYLLLHLYSVETDKCKSLVQLSLNNMVAFRKVQVTISFVSKYSGVFSGFCIYQHCLCK